MKIRFYNARILTMGQEETIFVGEVHIQDETIIYVGNHHFDTEWDREIDCKENLLMPGFKNAHSHGAMTGFRSFADDLPLEEWLYHKIFPLEAKMTGEDQYHLTQLAILEYLTSGITAMFDMYLSPRDVANACVDMGMRCVQVSAMTSFSQSIEQQEKLYLELNKRHPLLSYCLGFHAEYTNNKESLENVAALAKKYKAPVYAHNAETLFEVERCREKYGLTPTQLFDSLGLFEHGGGGYHCVYMTEDDLCIFKEKGLSVVTNPASNLKLASGIAPIKRLLEEGINVAIGTDGAASNNSLDMFREMFLVSVLSKFREGDAASMDALEVLKMATINGSKAMGLMNTDILAVGKLADMILLDLHMPNMQPIHNIAKNIVYSGSKQNVKMTMIHGKILYEDGRFCLDYEPEEIYQKANEIIDRLTT